MHQEHGNCSLAFTHFVRFGLADYELELHEKDLKLVKGNLNIIHDYAVYFRLLLQWP